LLLQDASTLLIFALVTLIVLAVVLRLCGQQPVEALGALLRGAFGNPVARAMTAARAAVLTFYALGIVFSFRAGTLNIGAEGQSRFAAAAATALGTGWASGMLGSLGVAGIFVVLIGGALAGALWSAIAGWLRQWRGVPEVISTLMLNFIAIELVKYFLTRPALLQGPTVEMKSAGLAAGLQLAGWETQFHPLIFAAPVAAILAHFVLFHTASGLQLRATGLNRTAAKTCGIPVERIELRVFAIAGAFAGLGGALGVLGNWHLGSVPTYPDYGFMAIAVALVANLKPLQVIPVAILFAALQVGTQSLEGSPGLSGFSHYMVYVIEGLIILGVLARGTRLFAEPAPPAAAEAGA